MENSVLTFVPVEDESMGEVHNQKKVSDLFGLNPLL